MKKGPGPLLDLRVLGGFELMVRGRQVTLPGRKPRALLAYLALCGNRLVTREKLANFLWMEVDGDPRQNLRQCLSTIWKVLRRADRRAAGVLEISRDEVSLRLAPRCVDALRLLELLADGGVARLERAFGMYAGPLLEGVGSLAPAFDSWLTVERNRVSALMLDAHRRLLDLHAAAGTPQRAIASVARFAAAEPFREEARRELMLLHAECGDTQAALRQYESYATLLRSEMGAEPEESTRQLARLLREGLSRPKASPRRMARPERPRPGAVSSYLATSALVLEQVPDCVVLTDLEGRIVGWNEWATRNFGYQKREVLGRTPAFLYGPGADAGITIALISKAIQHGRWSGVLRLFNRDGTSRLQKRTMMPLRDAAGEVVGVFGVTRPLTRPILGL